MTAMDAPTRSLTATATRGLAWQGVAFVLGRLLILLATILVARILGPANYGLVTLAVVIVTHLTIVADLGVGQALVYLPIRARRTDAGLASATCSSLVLAAALVLAAPYLTGALGHPGSGPLLQALSLVMVFNAIGQVPDSLLRRELRFRSRVAGELARATGRAGVAIGLVLYGLGPWSLVWGEVVGAVAFAVVSWILVRHRPRLRLDRRELRPLLTFGGAAACNGVLATLVLNVDYLIVGGILGATALGWYVVGFRLPEVLIISAFQVVSQVAFPLYARVGVEPQRLRKGYLVAFRLQATYGLAAGTTLAAIAPLVVPVLFGEGWGPAVQVLQAIGLYAAFRSLAAGAVDVFKGMGRPELGIWLGLGRLAVLVPVLIWSTQWGVVGVAWAQAVLALLFAVVIQRLAFRLVGVSMRAALSALRTAVVIAMLSGAAAMLGGYVLPAPLWVRLVVAGVLAVAAGGGALVLTDRRLVREVIAT